MKLRKGATVFCLGLAIIIASPAYAHSLTRKSDKLHRAKAMAHVHDFA